MKTTIEVEVSNIEADEYYFNFEYSLIINGKHKANGNYESDHSWYNDFKGLKRMLEDGEAAKLVLEYEL